ncbi:glycosyltransferase family 4 protein [Microbacterium arborescens]|uniref:glycosyltransferase family 4 protein n=1 Tax=Microbacterium arborescens TaxID=33883 RepID=UPI000DF7D72D|nr:glycosyltransferase family 4 protein [Microbacterium arborescens]
MRVRVVTSWYPTRRNPGAGSFIARDVQALTRDHDVEVLHLVGRRLDDGRRAFVDGGARVRRIPVDVRSPRGWVSVQRHLDHVDRGVDIVHTMAAPAAMPFALRRPRRPWVHTEHWGAIPRLVDEGPVGSGAALGMLLHGPDEVVAVGEHLADRIRAVRKRPVSVVGNIVDELPVPSTVRHERGGVLRVVVVASLVEWKGWRIALEAIRHLRDRGVAIELDWIGDGADRAEFLAQGADVIRSAPGHQDRAGVAQALADADVFLLPTNGETFSLATVEALSMGTPVVVTGAGEHNTFVTPAVGEAVSRDAAAIAPAILRAAELDREAVREHGRGLCARFSETAFREAYRSIYERHTGE